jgi:bifunctional oligoribonuclease and PAP phosphatase NrnA
MPLDWAPFVELVRRHRRFLLMTHVRPDGDGLGSELALADGLRHLGKAVRIGIASALPPRYRFLDPDGTRIERFQPPGESFRDVDAVLILDTGTWGQLGDFGVFLKTLDVPKMVIDHHRTQDDLGAWQLVDTTAEATGRLAYEALRALGAPLAAEAANALFLAIAMDTGWFRHPNTTAQTFDLAEELVRAGANPTSIFDALYEQNPLGRLRLVGRVLERMGTTAGGRVAYAEVYLADYPATGSGPPDTEDLIDFPRSIAGVEVALVFIEQAGGGVKVSFRSRSAVDVGKVAEQLGGGGHRLASGATLSEPMEVARRRVLEAVVPLLPQ